MAGVVACAQPEAADAAIEILERGGNAIDAAVAAALVQAVVDPLNASIGGFGVAQIRPAGADDAAVVGFHARASRNASADMFDAIAETASLEPLASGTFRVRNDANQIGHLSVAIPGTVRGLSEISTRFGALEWPDLLGPAIEMCKGWTVTGEQVADWMRPVPASRLSGMDRLTFDPSSAALYTEGGAVKRPGEQVVNTDYAETLAKLAEQGPSAFYRGQIADSIAYDFARNGGLIDADDLAGYRADIGAPLELEYGDVRVTTAPPPAGGVAVLEILRRLRDVNLGSLGHNTPDYVTVIAAAMRDTFSAMRRGLGDPDFVADPVGAVLGIDADHLEETTHVTAVDEWGGMAAITHSLGAASGVVTPGLGFIFNGAMHRFDPLPGRSNSIAPGKRRVTGMAPTIVWRSGRPVLIVGAAGGHSIVGAVAQVILNAIEFGMEPSEAVSAPRFLCEHDMISLEARFPATIATALEAAGEPVAVTPYRFDRTVAGSAQAISIAADGSLRGGADPRQAGISREGGQN